MDPDTFRTVSMVFLAGLVLVGGGLGFPIASALEDASIANANDRGASRLAGVLDRARLQADGPQAQPLYASLENLPRPAEVPAPSASVLVLGPSVPANEDEAHRVWSLMNESARVIVADDTGRANSLLSHLPTSTRVDNASLIDVAYRRQPLFPVLFSITAHPLTEDVDSVVANLAGAVREDPNATRLIASSQSSWLDRDGDGVPSANDTRGPHTVMSVERIGSGQLVVLSDPSLLSNGMLSYADNNQLAQNLARYATQGESATYVDETHREYRPFALVAHALPDASPTTTVVTLVVLVALPALFFGGLKLLAWAYERWLLPRPRLDDTVQQALKAHPEWREAELRRLADRLDGDPTGGEQGESPGSKAPASSASASARRPSSATDPDTQETLP